jgi:hypothetical protein
VHVQLLSISSKTINVRRDYDKLILCDEIPYTPFLAGRFVSVMRSHVEFKGRDQREEDEEQQVAGELHCGHHDRELSCIVCAFELSSFKFRSLSLSPFLLASCGQTQKSRATFTSPLYLADYEIEYGKSKRTSDSDC